jgi:hypothetical protein
MSQAEALDERLPWLADEPAPPPSRGHFEIAGWLALAAVAVGGGAYWLLFGNEVRETARETPAATIAARPQRVAQRAQEDMQPTEAPMPAPVPAPVVQPTPERQLETRTVEPASSTPPRQQLARPAPQPAAPTRREAAEVTRAPGSEIARPAAPAHAAPAVQPPQQFGGLVQVAAFADLKQARPVWTAMVSAYPALAQYRASLIENRDWNGRPFYQFQIGTGSRADSQALCRSVRAANFRCEVVAVP